MGQKVSFNWKKSKLDIFAKSQTGKIFFSPLHCLESPGRELKNSNFLPRALSQFKTLQRSLMIHVLVNFPKLEKKTQFHCIRLKGPY